MRFKINQIPLSLPHQPSYRGDDFVVGRANQMAVRWIESWPDWTKPYQGLNIYGLAGSGKTHLSHLLQEKNNAIRITALSSGDNLSVFSHIIIDDFDDLASIDQESLFHLINQIQTKSGTILILSRQPIARMDIALADLASRLRTFSAQEIYSPDDDLLIAVLAKLFADRQYAVSDTILNYLVRRMDRDYLAARQIVDIIDKTALACKKPISLSLIRNCLEIE